MARTNTKKVKPPKAEAKPRRVTDPKRFTKLDPLIQKYIIVPFDNGDPKVCRLMTDHRVTAMYVLGPYGIPEFGEVIKGQGREKHWQQWFDNTKRNKKVQMANLKIDKLNLGNDDTVANGAPDGEVTPKTAKKRAKGSTRALKLANSVVGIFGYEAKSARKKNRDDARNRSKMLDVVQPIIAAGASGTLEIDSSPSDGSNLTSRASPSDGSNLTGSTASPSSPGERFEPSPKAANLVPSADYVFKTPGKQPPAAPASPIFDGVFGADLDNDDTGVVDADVDVSTASAHDNAKKEAKKDDRKAAKNPSVPAQEVIEIDSDNDDAGRVESS